MCTPSATLPRTLPYCVVTTGSGFISLPLLLDYGWAAPFPSCHCCPGHLAHLADRQQSDPTAAGNDANPFDEPCWPVQSEGDGEEDIRGGDQQTRSNRIPGPAAPVRIGGIAPCQHEASRTQRDELKLAKNIMQDS